MAKGSKMSKMIPNFGPTRLLSVVVVALQLLVPVHAEKQEILLFNGLSEANAPFYMFSRKNEPDLVSYTSLNVTASPGHRMCYVGGVTVYTGVGYTGSGFHVAYSPSFECTVFLPGVSYRSLRFAGLQDDAEAPTLSFYAQPQFIGQQTVIRGDQPNLPVISGLFASIYKTGREPWSLYTGLAYGGVSYCLETGVDVIVDVASLGLQPGDIRSARIGCTGLAIAVQADLVTKLPVAEVPDFVRRIHERFH